MSGVLVFDPDHKDQFYLTDSDLNGREYLIYNSTGGFWYTTL